VSLPADQRDEALRRWRLLQPHVEEGVPLTRAAAAAGIPLRSAQSWLTRYRAEGLVGLVRPPRSDRGRRRFPADLVALVEGLALRQPAPSAAHVHRQAAAVAEREGWPVPSYGTVFDIVRAIDPALRTLALDQRAALVLVDMLGYPVAEAAAILGTTEGTVKSRCSRGRARLLPQLAHLRGSPAAAQAAGVAPAPPAGPAARNHSAAGDVSPAEGGGESR